MGKARSSGIRPWTENRAASKALQSRTRFIASQHSLPMARSLRQSQNPAEPYWPAPCPRDVRLIPVGLETIPKVAEPGNIAQLHVWRNRWLIAAAGRWDVSRAAGRLDLSLVDLRTGKAEFKQSWPLDEFIGEPINGALCCYFENRPDGTLGFLLIAKANLYDCRLSDSNPEIPELHCVRSDRELKDSLAFDEDGVRERLAKAVPGGFDYSVSPSGRWVAWLFNPDPNDLDGEDTIYLTPTADLLKP